MIDKIDPVSSIDHALASSGRYIRLGRCGVVEVGVVASGRRGGSTTICAR